MQPLKFRFTAWPLWPLPSFYEAQPIHHYVSHVYILKEVNCIGIVGETAIIAKTNILKNNNNTITILISSP